MVCTLRGRRWRSQFAPSELVERQVRYFTRTIFAGERLAWIEVDQRLVYHFPKPRPDGQTALYLTPLECMEVVAGYGANARFWSTPTTQLPFTFR